MPKNILIIIAVLALLGAGWYFYAGKNAFMPYSSNNSQGSSVGEKMSGKLADLINAGKSLECTYSTEADGYKSEGTMFVSGNKVRGDFQSQANGKMMDSHMFQDGETVYTWTTEPKQGMMMKISKEDAQKFKDGPESSSNQSFDMNKDYNYDCKPWGVDQSKFEVPKDIEFMDISAQIGKSTITPQKGNTSACSTCDSLDDEAKASCKQALNCK